MHEAQSVLVLLITLGLFLSSPLRHPSEYYGSDILITFPTLQPPIPKGYTIKNGGISDSVTALQPFYYQNREQARRGIFPLWDPYIGYGVPHLANESSAVFALPTAVFYILSFKQALLVSAFLKLFLCGLFMYLFLRLLRLGHLPALIGAIGFMYCGYNIYWLPNSAVSVTSALPMTLFFLEKGFASSGRARLGWWSGIAASIALGFFAGHPETFAFIVVFVALYALVRLLAHTDAWIQRAISLGLIAGAATIGIVLTAIQLLPFLEYYAQSNQLASRAQLALFPIPPPAWLLNVFPNIYGNPGASYSVIQQLIVRGAPMNILEANGGYVGAFALFLVFIALLYVRKYPLVLLFVLTAGTLFAYQYDQLGINHLVRYIPLFNKAQPGRSQPVTAFCISAAAAFGVQAVSTWRTNRWRRACMVVGGIIFPGVALLLAPAAWRAAKVDTSAAPFRAYMPGQMTFVVIGVLVGVIGIACVAHARPGVRTIGMVISLVVVFSQSGWLLRDFNPTVPAAMYAPRTATVAAIQRIVGDNNMMFLTDRYMRADINLFYDLRIPGNYDALGVQRFYQLHTAVLGVTPEGAYPADVDPYVLKLFGADYIVNDQPPGTRVGETANPPNYFAQPLITDRITQTFTPQADNLRQVDVQFVTFARKNTCDSSMTLYAAWDNDRMVGEYPLPCADIADGAFQRIAFPPEAQSAGKTYRLEITSTGASAKNCIGLPLSTAAAAAGTQLMIGNAAKPGSINYQLRYGASRDFTQEYQDSRLSVYRYTGSPGRFWAVGAAMQAPDDAAALKVVAARQVDPVQTVVLTSAPVAGLTGETSIPRVEHDQADHVTMTTDRQSPGYLVAAMTFFPGWKARVNGHEVPIQVANYAFMALPVPAGKSTVELYYAPDSFKWGAIITSITLGTLSIFWCWLGWRGWQMRRRSRKGVGTSS